MDAAVTRDTGGPYLDSLYLDSLYLDSPCLDCPVSALSESVGEPCGEKEHHNDRLSIAEIVALSPSKLCNKVFLCLTNLLTTCQGKPPQTDYPQANVTLYQNGSSQPFASCLVIWQACNIMTRRAEHEWQADEDGAVYEYQGRSGKLTYRLPRAVSEIGDIDIRAVLMHLLLAACATQKSRPWEEEVILNDRVISDFLGLKQRKDMNRFQKLLLIQSFMEQACELSVALQWQQRGSIPATQLPLEPLWSVNTTYHIATNEDGSHYLSGLSFRILAGRWSAYFLNQEKAKIRTAYYQYGWLPMSLPPKIMHLWKRHEGGVAILIYLLFRMRVDGNRSAKVATLLRLIYGEAHLQLAWYNAEVRRKLIGTFEADLEQLFYYGLKPVFDSVTYPEDAQPVWLNAQNIPDDPEEALAYWTNDASESKAGIRSKEKWIKILNASITAFELPEDWQVDLPKPKSRQRPRVSSPPTITGDTVKKARVGQGISQRQLSALLAKSQSWIRDIESGRYRIKPGDVALLASVLDGLSA